MQFLRDFFRYYSKKIGHHYDTHKKLWLLLALVLLLCVLGVCWRIGVGQSQKGTALVSDFPHSEAELEKNFPNHRLLEADRKTEPGSAATEIDLSTHTDTLSVTEGGEYILRGELNGSIHIDCRDETVHLFLQNATVTAKKGAAVYCEDAGKLVITLMPESENFVSDSGDYLADAELEACIYSTCDLTLNGTGKLTVNGYYKDAIRSRDMLKIADGSYTIKCKRTALHGTDGIHIGGGEITVSSEKYGLKTTKKGADSRGAILISGGKMTLIAGRYAFVAEKASLYVFNCEILNNSVIDTYSVGGMKYIEEGCIR